MSEPRKLLTFIADFLDDGEAYPLRGAPLRQAVLENPRVELERYGLGADHVDLLLEHGPDPGVLLAAVREEIVVAMNEAGPGEGGVEESAAPYLWPGDAALTVECLEFGNVAAASITAAVNAPTSIGIVGGGFSRNTRFYFEKAGGPTVVQAGPEAAPASAVDACPDARQRVSYQFTFPEPGVYYLRAKASDESSASGLNDTIRVEVQ